jgi:hypothetical protein
MQVGHELLHLRQGVVHGVEREVQLVVLFAGTYRIKMKRKKVSTTCGSPPQSGTRLIFRSVVSAALLTI